MGPRDRAIVAIYGALALLVVPVFPHFVSPNELSRWVAAASLVERGSLALPPDLVSFLGPRFEDLSENAGRVYPNKAPGAALAGLPGYLAVRPIAGGPAEGSVRLAVTAMRWTAATVPLLALGWAFARTAAALGAEPAPGGAALLVLLFGTPLLAFGLLLFAHALVAFCLFGAFALLFVAPGTGAPRAVGAGSLLGLAVFAEYPALVPVLLLLGAAAWGRGGLRRAGLVVAGALPFAALFFTYNALCFGSPLSLPVGHERFGAFQVLRRHGVFGIGLPRPGQLVRLVLDPSKGLLVLSPVLALAAGGVVGVRRHLSGAGWFAFLAVPASLLLLYSGFPDWHGGWGVGARYVVPALPFLVLPLAFLRWGPIASALAGASVVAVAATSLVFPFVPPGFPLPWGSFAAPLLASGLVAPNLLHLVARPLALAVPFLLVGAAAALAFRRTLVTFTAGALLWLGAGLALSSLSPLSPPLVVQRAYVKDVYFLRPGALEEEMPGGQPPPAGLLRRRELETTLPPPAWPF